MRISLAVVFFVCIACCSRADETAADETPAGEALLWQQPFQAISGSDASEALVLILITNEDPFLPRARSSRSGVKRKASPEPKLKYDPPAWCSDVLALSLSKVFEKRSDLRSRLQLQSIAAGMPRELTGGVDRNVRQRAIVALCDGNYRMLGLTVGVPDTDSMLTLLEDAEEVAGSLELHSDEPSQILELIAERSSERLSRMWRRTLDQMMTAMGGDRGEEDTDRLESFEGRLRFLSDTLEPVYLADVKLRFGLSETSDRSRLIILEQHPEARRPWCEAMIPFLVNQDYSLIWRELAESLWGHQPVTADVDAQDLLQWYELHAKTDSMVLSLQSPFHLRRLPWPPILDKAAKRGMSWQEVHQLAQEKPFRTIQPQQLATLIRQQHLPAIDIQQPSLARYLLFEPNKEFPLVIREADPPGRFAGMLRRSKSSLVKK